MAKAMRARHWFLLKIVGVSMTVKRQTAVATEVLAVEAVAVAVAVAVVVAVVVGTADRTETTMRAGTNVHGCCWCYLSCCYRSPCRYSCTIWTASSSTSSACQLLIVAALRPSCHSAGCCIPPRPA